METISRLMQNVGQPAGQRRRILIRTRAERMMTQTIIMATTQVSQIRFQEILVVIIEILVVIINNLLCHIFPADQ